MNLSGQATPPAGATGVVAVAAGGWHSLALRNIGVVVGWGQNGAGQATPPAVTGVVAIAGGGYHSLAVRSNGTVVGWGLNGSGQATAPAAATGVVAVAAGGYHSLALRSDGSVVAWGTNDYGQATPPPEATGVVAIAAGFYHSLALRSDGTVVGWGSNGSGQTNCPAGLTGVVAIAAGYQHSLALKSDGTVIGWGDDTYGQMNPPLGLGAVVTIAAGRYHSLTMSCAGGVPAVASATWTNANVSGNWSEASSWKPVGIPDYGASVIFGTAGVTAMVDNVSRTVGRIGFHRSGDFFVSASGGANLTITNGITVVSNVASDFTHTVSAPVLLGGSNTWSIIGNGILRVSGPVSGAHPIIKTGSGTLVFSGTNVFSGATIISNGTLAVTGAGLITNTASIDIASGARLDVSGRAGGNMTLVSGQTLKGGGTVQGNLVLADGAVLSPRGGSVGTLSFLNDLAVSNAAVLQYELGTNGDLTAVSSNLTLGGTLNITDTGGLDLGSYTLFTYGGVLSYNGLAIGNTPAGYAYSIDTGTVGQVRLNVSLPLSTFAQWQTAYFSSTSNPAAGSEADPDGDGMSNTDEFLAGTNPTNSLSGLRIISIVPRDNDVVIVWTTVGGRTNAVQATAGVVDGGYTAGFVDLSGLIIISGSGDTTTNYVDVGGVTNGPARYYRIRLVP
jgi:autotransporter-associated beta strand protein